MLVFARNMFFCVEMFARYLSECRYIFTLLIEKAYGHFLFSLLVSGTSVSLCILFTVIE